MSSNLQLLAAIAVRPLVSRLVNSFETEAGLEVESRWALNPAIKSQIEAGAPFDLVITNPDFIEQLTALGKIQPDTQFPFGRIRMGVAVRAGTEAPNVDTVELFADALRAANSIAYASEGSSGAYFTGLLDRLGLAAAVGPKLIPILGSGTASSVARGEAQLAVVPVTSILAAGPDVMLVGRFPLALGGHIDFDLAISAASPDPTGARRLAEFLASPQHNEALRGDGLDRRS